MKYFLIGFLGLGLSLSNYGFSSVGQSSSLSLPYTLHEREGNYWIQGQDPIGNSQTDYSQTVPISEPSQLDQQYDKAAGMYYVSGRSEDKMEVVESAEGIPGNIEPGLDSYFVKFKIGKDSHQFLKRYYETLKKHQWRQKLADAINKGEAYVTFSRSNEIEDIGVQNIAAHLPLIKRVKNLSLDFNQLGAESARLLAEGLKGNTVLQTLSLDSNQIGDEGARWLGEALKANTVLQTLSLGANQIGDEGARWLGEALKANTALQTLSLDSNQIGDEGVIGLAEGLKDNKVLQTLSLDFNQIGDEGKLALQPENLYAPRMDNLSITSNFISRFTEVMTEFMSERSQHFRRNRCQISCEHQGPSLKKSQSLSDIKELSSDKASFFKEEEAERIVGRDKNQEPIVLKETEPTLEEMYPFKVMPKDMVAKGTKEKVEQSDSYSEGESFPQMMAEGTAMEYELQDDPRFLISYPILSKAPWRHFGHLQVKLRNKYYNASAFMAGNQHIITAAHCVLIHQDANLSYLAEEIKFYPARDGDHYSQCVKVVDALLPAQFIHYRSQEWDVSLLTLEKPLDIGFSCIGVFKDDILNSFSRLCVTGYPGEKCKRMYTLAGPISELQPHLLRYSILTSLGNSGSSVWAENHPYEQGRPVITAVHTRGGGGTGTAVRFTEPLIKQFTKHLNKPELFEEGIRIFIQD